VEEEKVTEIIEEVQENKEKLEKEKEEENPHILKWAVGDADTFKIWSVHDGDWTIYKYPLKVDQLQTIPVGDHARILDVINIRDTLVLYAMVDKLEDPKVDYEVNVVGTGSDTNNLMKDESGGWNFLRTLEQLNGRLVWHVFWRRKGGPKYL
jgi:hypothetical protein